MSGFSPIITTASPAQSDFLKSIGATNILDRNLSPEHLLNELSKIVDKDRIKYVFDAISSEETQQTGFHILPAQGHLAVVAQPSANKPADINVVRVLSVLKLPQNIRLLEALYSQKVYGYLEKGSLKVRFTL